MQVDHQSVMSLIQPFVAHADFSDLRKHQVRLVHQSIKEFIIRKWASNRPDLLSLAISTQAAIDQALVQQRTDSLEASILDVCIRYLLLDHIGDTDLLSEEHVAIEVLPKISTYLTTMTNQKNEAWEGNMIHYDPIERGFGELFVYASCHWIEHFGAILVKREFSIICYP